MLYSKAPVHSRGTWVRVTGENLLFRLHIYHCKGAPLPSVGVKERSHTVNTSSALCDSGVAFVE